ncbi:lactate racemase domain-containing protein [Candidatus Neomarinimicrobiota bacterium]
MIVGIEDKNRILSEEEITNVCKEVFSKWRVSGKRLLFIIPDNTRSAPIDLMFRICYNLLVNQVKALDFLIALGTHPPLSIEEIYKRVNITKNEKETIYSKAQFFNHDWKSAKQLVKIGHINNTVVNEISGGILDTGVDITINKLVLEYDLLIIIGPTYPHEVAGFSGGNKYLFPGISGQEIINLFHWLGALITNININGVADTPVRQIIDRAAAMVPTRTVCMSLVTAGEGLAGLYAGNPLEAWTNAVRASSKLHIIYKDHQYKKVLSCVPEMYTDLWTGAKGMYKLESIVATGGELILYAPHIKEVSVTHGKLIEQIGYHVKQYFTQQANKFEHIPGGIRAHSTHLKGVGAYINGIESPRIKVVLATGISEETCEKINLDYINPASIDVESWNNRETEGILIVKNAGEMLYRLSDG